MLALPTISGSFSPDPSDPDDLVVMRLPTAARRSRSQPPKPVSPSCSRRPAHLNPGSVAHKRWPDALASRARDGLILASAEDRGGEGVTATAEGRTGRLDTELAPTAHPKRGCSILAEAATPMHGTGRRPTA